MKSALENITAGQVLLALMFVTMFIQTVTNLRGSWRKWLSHEVSQVNREVKEMKKTVQAVEHEMKPNGGKSLTDKVDRIENAVRGLSIQSNSMSRRLDVIESKVADE